MMKVEMILLIAGLKPNVLIVSQKKSEGLFCVP